MRHNKSTLHLIRFEVNHDYYIFLSVSFKCAVPFLERLLLYAAASIERTEKGMLPTLEHGQNKKLTTIR
jgi:hypothetical protein